MLRPLTRWMAFLCLSCALPLAAWAQTFQAGEHYEELPLAVETQSDGVEVVEVFSYACIHCYNFDPIVEHWSANTADDVEFERVPAVFNAVWQLLAQAYYTAEVLEVGEQLHMPLFEAIHKKGIDIRDPDLMAGLFETHGGVARADFDAAYNSFGVRSRVQQASARGRAYRIQGVPTMIVNGKYRVDAGMAGGHEQMLAVVDYLVEQERAAGASASGGQ